MYKCKLQLCLFFLTLGCMNPSSSESTKESHGQEASSKPCSLVLSGGEGYINFRIGKHLTLQVGGNDMGTGYGHPALLSQHQVQCLL